MALESISSKTQEASKILSGTAPSRAHSRTSKAADLQRSQSKHPLKHRVDGRKTKIRVFCSAVCFWLGIAVSIQVACHLLGRLSPVLELASHFSLHVIGFVLLLLPGLLFFRRFIMSAVMVASCGILLLSVQPWTLMPAASPSAQGKTQLQVLSWNILSANQQLDEIKSLLQNQAADVVVLYEVSPSLKGMFEELRYLYPIQLEKYSWGGEGIAVLSKLEDTQLRFEDFGQPRQPAIVATLPGTKHGDAPLQLVGMHTLSPIPTYRSRGRDLQLKSVASWTSTNSDAVCLCGDLNITPWAPGFQELLDAGLRDTRVGLGNMASWPASLGPLGIPIDHVLHNDKCQIISREVLSSSPGSDHKPILFTVDY